MFVIINRHGKFKRVFGYTWIADRAIVYATHELALADCRGNGEWPIPYADTI